MDKDEFAKIKQNNKRCCGGKRKVIIVLLIPLGILIAVTGMFLHKIFTDIVKKELVLSKGSEAYNNWYIPPSPVYMHYYLFNYTNVQDIINKHATPNVSQIGPFVYREIRINQVVDYNEYNITYLQNYSYVFEPSLSCPTCKENNIVYIPNIAFLTVLTSLYEQWKNPSWPISFALNVYIDQASGASLFKKLKVGEVLWGYEDNLLKNLKQLAKFLKKFGVKLPPIASSKIALQYNGTANANEVGNITILTGKENINDVQRIVRWRGLDNAPYWNTKYGDMINGTDGSHAPPFVLRDKKWYVFVPQLCRSLYFEYQKDESYDDIPLYRYSTTAKLFSGNLSVNPDNVAFCNDTETCRDGLLPLSKCQAGGPPIYASAPHFYQADPELVKRIKGLRPNALLHANTLDVEPITGVTMRAYKRLQINIMGRRSWIDKSKAFQYDVNFLPILMIEEVAVIDDATAEKFRNMVLVPKDIMAYGRYILLVVGASLIIIASVFIYQLIIDYYKGQYKSFGGSFKNKVIVNDEVVPDAVYKVKDEAPIYEVKDEAPIYPDKDEIHIYPDIDELHIYLDKDETPIYPDKDETNSSITAELQS